MSRVPPALFDRPGRTTAALFALVGGTAALYLLFWPAGVAFGLVAGSAAVLVVGLRMRAEWFLAETDTLPAALLPEPVAAERPAGSGIVGGEAAPVEPAAGIEQPVAVRPELQALKERLGDREADFTRAAALVITTQYASAARLQRELHVPYSRARRLLDDLESSKIVGPPTGTSPRRVLLARDDLADLDLDRLLA